CARIKQGFAYW
nr:immunoglobulin heavy chain junction region [Mus musculus]